MLVKATLEEFNQILGSNSPAPGGGSVSALAGALGAELLSMVCRLSIGRDEFEAYQGLLQETLEKAQVLAGSLTKRIDLDTEAFNDVMKAFKMPKGTEEEKQARKDAIQAGYKEAVQSPMEIATECLNVLRLAEQILGKSNTGALSDLGVAGQMALAGLEGSVMNVRINLPSIKDMEFVGEKRTQVIDFIEEGNGIAGNIYSFVQDNIG